MRRAAAIGSIAATVTLCALAVGSSAAPAARGSGAPAELFAVDALTASNAWAVGDHFPDPTDYGDYFTTTKHFRGAGWSTVNSPGPPSYKAALFGVDALSGSNIWAAGQYNARNGNDFTLIEHWAGGTWRIVKSPNPGSFGNGFSDVAAVTANNVWAVGYYGPPKTLVAHWGGGGWKKVASRDPAAGDGNVLYGVSAAGAGNVWAVGYSVSSSGPRTLIEHWNGSSWQVQKGVDPSNTDNELLAVQAISPSDAWAVGYFTDGTGDHPLLLHYDGNSWAQVAGAALNTEGALSAVSAASSTDVWAVGSTGVGSTKTLIEHWDGGVWTRMTSPSPSNSENALLGVSARASGDVWAVGYYASSSGHKSLVEHWNGSAWSVK